MAEMSDELLMAYADGALDPAARATVEAAMLRNPEYREKVEKFRATRSPIREAFRQEPASSHLGPLIDRIRRDEVPSTVAAVNRNAARVVWISRDKAKTQGHGWRQQLPAAMAASVVFMVGAALGWSLHSGRVAVPPHSPGLVLFSDGGILAQGALQELLETVSSGTQTTAKAEAGETWELKASFTFRSTSNLPCRRYEISAAAAGRFGGYACRSSDGQWFIHAHTRLETMAAHGNGFAPAAGDGDAALDAAIRIVMDGDVYQSKEEQQLIAARWATVRK